MIYYNHNKERENKIMERYIVYGVNGNGFAYADPHMFNTIKEANKRCIEIIREHLKKNSFAAKCDKITNMEQYNNFLEVEEISGNASIKDSGNDEGGLLCWFDYFDYFEAQVCKVTGE